MSLNQKRRFADGELIFREGDQGDCAYIIDSGRVEIFVESGDEHVTLTYLGVGEIFGEMSVIDGSPRSASARAIEPCEMSVISNEAISERIDASDSIVRLLINMLLKRMRSANESTKRLQTSTEPVKATLIEKSSSVDGTKQQTEVLEKMRIESELKEALNKKEFNLHFQPIIDMNSRRIEGMEALIRWNNPSRGLVRPDIFMGIAEETSLIVPIGKWVIECGCASLVKLQDILDKNGFGWFKPFISLNISGRQFYDPSFFTHLQETARTHSIDCHQVKLEVTERVLMEGPTARHALSKLRDLAFPVSLDDFGTGFSSLSYLAQFQVDSIKIDKSFVRRLLDDQRTHVITEAIIAMANGLRIPVIAEGIETEEEYAELCSMQCRYGQGFLFSKPVPFEDATKLLLESLTQTKSKTS